MARAPLFAVVVLLATVAIPSAGAVAKGEERVLVVLATSGPQPYSVAEVERTARQADAFFRTSSFGQEKLNVDVTPWLEAFSSNPGCGGASNRTLEAVVAPARVAADRAGYNPADYDDVIYTIADSHCGFHGATWGHEVMLTTQPSLQLMVHELGHTFGLGHAQASNCADFTVKCSLYDTGDTLSPMGTGTLDFSAYEKFVLGWIPEQPHVTAARRYVLAPPTSRSRLAQALVVETERGAWWIEYRAKPFRGLVVRFVDNVTIVSPFAPSAVLMRNPTKAGRPWIARGESFRIPGSFRFSLTRTGSARAEVRFRP